MTITLKQVLFKVITLSVSEPQQQGEKSVHAYCSKGSLLPVPTEQERRRLGEKTWERG